MKAFTIQDVIDYAMEPYSRLDKTDAERIIRHGFNTLHKFMINNIISVFHVGSAAIEGADRTAFVIYNQESPRIVMRASKYRAKILETHRIHLNKFFENMYQRHLKKVKEKNRYEKERSKLLPERLKQRLKSNLFKPYVGLSGYEYRRYEQGWGTASTPEARRQQAFGRFKPERRK
jgi:hypothetical protein